MKNKKIEFRLATSSNAVEMVDFHNSYYGTKRRPEDWLWEYITYNPDKAVAVFATDSGKIIATQGMLPIYLVIGTKTVLAGKSESTLLLPTYRGTQIMQNLYEYAVGHCINNGMQFIWGFTGALTAFKKFGFTTYPDIQMMTRPGNIWIGIHKRLTRKTSILNRIGSAGKFVLRYFVVKRRKIDSQYYNKEKYELRRGICDSFPIKEMYRRLSIKHKNLIMIKYDYRYLQWRVFEHPFIKYDIYQVLCGHELKAYAIVAFYEGIVSVSDLTSEDKYSSFLLLDAILKDYGKKAGEFRFLGNTKDVLAQDVFKQLCQFGFSVIGNWNFVLRDLTEGDNGQIYNMHNWHINGLWTEGYSM